MPNATAMIYSTNLFGHRQLYCDALTDVFLELGYDILLVVGLTQKKTLPNWKHIERYRNHPRVSILDSYKFEPKQGRLTVPQIIQIQKQHSISVTIYPCGDELRDEFSLIANDSGEKLVGSNIGIFGMLDGWFPMDGPFADGLQNKERLRTIRDIVWKKHPVRRFYERVIRSKRVLDIAFLKDERAAKKNDLPFMWWPEIYRPYEWKADADEQAEFNSVVPAYQDFLEEHSDKEILLYFGAASRYKGYDSLLRLAAEDQSSVFILCGKQDLNEKYDEDVRDNLRTLQSEGRFFGTNRRIIGWETVDYFFRSIRYYVSTHRFYGSSGTVLQALNAGKPVLTPNRGTLGYRTTTYQLGRVYNPNKRGDLLDQWEDLKKDSYNQYSLPIANFIERFSKNHVVETISQALSACA